jgi:hypothetical protein
MANGVQEWTRSKAFLIIFGAVLLALIARDALEGIVEGMRAAVAD